MAYNVVTEGDIMLKKDKIISIVTGVAIVATLTTAGAAAAGVLSPQQQAEVDISSAVSEGLQQISEATSSAVSEITNTASSSLTASKNTGAAQTQQVTTPSVNAQQSSAQEATGPIKRTFDLSGKSISANGVEIEFVKADVGYSDNGFNADVQLSYIVKNISYNGQYQFTNHYATALDVNLNKLKDHGDCSYNIQPGGTFKVLEEFADPGVDVSKVTFTYNFDANTARTITFDFPKS